VGARQYGAGRDISVHTAHRRGDVLTVGRLTSGDRLDGLVRPGGKF
jgi:hypothetical protein